MAAQKARFILSFTEFPWKINVKAIPVCSLVGGQWQAVKVLMSSLETLGFFISAICVYSRCVLWLIAGSLCAVAHCWVTSTTFS